MVLSKDTLKNASAIFNKAWDLGRDILYEHEVYALLNCLGLTTPKFVFVKDASEITSETLSDFGKEIMVKIVSKNNKLEK